MDIFFKPEELHVNRVIQQFGSIQTQSIVQGFRGTFEQRESLCSLNLQTSGGK